MKLEIRLSVRLLEYLWVPLVGYLLIRFYVNFDLALPGLNRILLALRDCIVEISRNRETWD